MTHLDHLAVAVAEVMPAVIARIPADPAAQLGRLGAREAPESRPRMRVGSSHDNSPVLGALRSLGDLVAERLLGALELAVGELTINGPGGLTAELPPGVTGRLAFAAAGDESEAARATTLFDRSRPGAIELVSSLVTALAEHDAVAPLLVVEDSATEADIAARHGAVHLALAVAAATAVSREIPGWSANTAAIVGTALGSAALLLKTKPMPDAYAEALQEKRRAKYFLPRHASD